MEDSTTKEWMIRCEMGQEIAVAEEIAVILQRYAESGPRIEEIKTAITEACLNAMEHGNRMSLEKRVKIVFYVRPDEWIIRINDEGTGFSLDSAGKSRAEQDQDDDPRGWGLQFIRTFADRIATGWDKGMFYIEMHFERGGNKMDRSFHINVRTTEKCVILDLSGDLTKNSEEALMKSGQWEQGLNEGRAYLILNFLDVPYINSAGIALLIRLTRLGVKSGFKTFSYGVSPHYQKLFRIVGLTEYMMVYPDEYAVQRRIDELGH